MNSASYEDHQPQHRRLLRCAKWAGLLLSVLIAFTFVVSTRLAVVRTGPKLEYEAGVIPGAIGYGWDTEAQIDAAKPGWVMDRWQVQHHSGDELYFWIERRVSSTSTSLIVPLWMPFVIVAAPTVILWYRDRRNIAIVYRRWQERLCPGKRRRVTVGLVVVSCLAHAVAVILGAQVVDSTYRFFFPAAVYTGNPLYSVMLWMVPILLLPLPLWGILWARLYVRMLNRLFIRVRPHCCLECGYDLTGNLSGVCSECGVAFRDSTHARAVESSGQ